MKKILSIVFLVVPLLFFTSACGEETQAKVSSTVEQVAPVVKNVVEKTKTAVEAVETATVEAVKSIEKKIPVASSTVVAAEEETVAKTEEVVTNKEAVSETETAAEPIAMAVPNPEGAVLFKNNCAACHVGGGNLVNAMKTLKKDALEKYDMYSKEAIVYQITNGKNAMPAFGSRLSSGQIESLAEYVLAEADKGW